MGGDAQIIPPEAPVLLMEAAGRFQVTRSEPTWAGEGQRLVLLVVSLRTLLEQAPPHRLRGYVRELPAWASETHPCVFPQSWLWPCALAHRGDRGEQWSPVTSRTESGGDVIQAKLLQIGISQLGTMASRPDDSERASCELAASLASTHQMAGAPSNHGRHTFLQATPNVFWETNPRPLENPPNIGHEKVQPGVALCQLLNGPHD